MALTRPKASQINFDVTNISDPLIRLNSDETGTADKDSGLVIERGDDANVAVIYDESADQFAFINTDETGTTSGNVTIASYANIQASSIAGTLTTAAQTNITSLGTIGSLVATTADINAGTFDGVVGGTTPAAVSATTLTATGAFTSLGIDDNADAVAMTILSTEITGFGTTSPLGTRIHVFGSGTQHGTSGSDGTRELIVEGPNLPITDSMGNIAVVANNTQAANMGGQIAFMGKTTDSANTISTHAVIKGAKENSTSANIASYLAFSTRANGAGNTEKMRIASTGYVGIGTTPTKQLHITKSAIAEIIALSDGATITPDFDAGQNFSVTLAGNRTLANPSNITAGQTGSIFVTQDGTGSRTLAYGSYWDFAAGTAPTMTTTAAAVDRIDYIVRTSTSIHAVATLAYS